MLDAFLPIWALTLAGYLAVRVGVLGPEAERALSRFVFYVAMPPALYLAVSRARLDPSQGLALAGFGAAVLLVTATGFVVSRVVFGRKLGEATIAAMAAGYVNSANIGLPVAIWVLGNASFLVGVTLLNLLVLTPVLLTLLDRGADSAASRRERVRHLLTLPLRNPVIIGSALGAAASAGAWRTPEVVTAVLQPLGAAAVPTALVALGISLRTGDADLDGARAEVAAVVGLKVLVSPLVAYAVGEFLLGLDPRDLLAVVVCAALPTAQNTFILATEYAAAPTLARRAIVISTVLSMVTLTLASALLAGAG